MAEAELLPAVQDEQELKAGKQAVANLLPELPAYIESSLTNLKDDNGLHFNSKPLSKEQKATLCRTYAKLGSIRATCESADVSLSRLHAHLSLDKEFRAAFSLAKLSIGDDIQATSVQRAREPNGVIDRMCQLKRFFPNVYRESKQSVAIGIHIDFGP